jgi:hypothetical protein
MGGGSGGMENIVLKLLHTLLVHTTNAGCLPFITSTTILLLKVELKRIVLHPLHIDSD